MLLCGGFVSQGYRSTNLEQISGARNSPRGGVLLLWQQGGGAGRTAAGVQDIVVDRALAAVDLARPQSQDRLVAYVHYQANLGITHRRGTAPDP